MTSLPSSNTVRGVGRGIGEWFQRRTGFGSRSIEGSGLRNASLKDPSTAEDLTQPDNPLLTAYHAYQFVDPDNLKFQLQTKLKSLAGSPPNSFLSQHRETYINGAPLYARTANAVKSPTQNLLDSEIRTPRNIQDTDKHTKKKKL